MSKDFWKLMLWVLGFTALFLTIAWSATLFTDVSLMDAAHPINAIGILVAICVGGVFAYQRLRIFRTFTPHLTISHDVNHRLLSDSYIHIGITATLHNSSRVHIELREGFFLLQRIAPSTDDEIYEMCTQVFVDDEERNVQWPIIYRNDRVWDEGELIVEQGAYHPETYEFVVPRNIRAVSIYTYFANPRFTPGSQFARGWAATTFYDIFDHELDSAPG